MYYTEVVVGSPLYHGSEPLTYATEHPLKRGQIVSVPLRNQQVLGIVLRQATKPAFATKPVSEIFALPPLPEHMLGLLTWIPNFYPAPLGVIANHFLPKRITPLPPKKPIEKSVTQAASSLPPLTKDQQHALANIASEGMHILHGETGSGKTRVYIELAQHTLGSGKSALILTPEISLTSQLAEDFSDIFGDAVIVVHSRLTEATRRKIWLELLRSDEPRIIIGPRSALFMPMRQLGLIVIDEAHEPAYKQDQAPYYHTTRLASMLAGLAHCPVVLGSATPAIADYFLAKEKNRPIIRMQQTASSTASAPERTIRLVDLRDRQQFPKNAHLSTQLLKAISETLQKHEQVLLFLNRRGTARVIFCEQCGWQADCPHCDTPLVYHGDIHTMRCHICNYTAPNPVCCPACGHAGIVYKSIGTKAIADDIARLFPDASIQRFDADNKKADRIEEHYEDVRAGKVDIIIGTQMLAKGLDLPKLGLVGVIVADTSLFIPDFSAQERTYQLLRQVIGRVGRGHRASQAIIQTYNPDSPILRAALQNTWEDFYTAELAERKKFVFPPFCYLLTVRCRRASSKSAETAAERFATELYGKKLPILIDGPAPAFREKSREGFTWQLVIKTKRRDELLKIIKLLPSGWSYDIDPLNLL